MKFKLNNQLVACLAERNIRQSQLAYRLKMSPAYVCRVSKGKIRPSLESAIRIARYFGKPVEAIFQLVDEDGKQMNFPDAPPSAPGNQTTMTEKENKIKCN